MLLHGLSAGGAKPAFTDPLKTPKHVASYGWLCYIRADFDALSSFKAGTTPPDAGTPRVSRGPYDGRVDVSEPASISSGIAARYATAIFEIAKENNNVDCYSIRQIPSPKQYFSNYHNRCHNLKVISFRKFFYKTF